MAGAGGRRRPRNCLGPAIKASDGFTKGWASAITVIAACLSVWLLGIAVKVLPVGTAYGAWTGIGTVGAALLGIVFFNEPATAARLVCVLLIIAGIIGLKVLGNA